VRSISVRNEMRVDLQVRVLYCFRF